MNRLLITGGSGLLAVNAAITLRDSHAVTLGLHDRAVALAGVSTTNLNLESSDELARQLKAQGPELVIHTASVTSVEKCEADPQLAHHVNVDLAENVAAACSQLGIPLVHISTDHLFGGGESFLDETSATAPLNHYGRTKAEAETRVLQTYPAALVVRTNFYAWGTSYRRSFSDVVIDSLRIGSEVTLFDDVFVTPILAEKLAVVLLDLAESKARGVYHVTGDVRVSKYELGQLLAQRFGLNNNLIKRGKLAGNPRLTRRPKDMSLSNTKCTELLRYSLGNPDSHIERLFTQEKEGIMKEIRGL